MSRPNYLDDLIASLRDMERRLVAVERSSQLVSSSIKEGALTVLDATGTVRVRVGKDGSDYGVKLFDAAGANPVSLATLAFGIEADQVNAGQSTSSTSYTDLATAGPAVTADIGPSGRAIVTVTARILTSGLSNDGGLMSFAVSGATTVAADDDFAVLLAQVNSAQLAQVRASATTLVTGLTEGSNTFTAKYRTFTGGSNTFSDRVITVQPF